MRFLLVGAALVGAGCQAQSQRASAAQAPGGPPVSFSKVTLSEFDGQIKVWDLEARHVDYDKRLAALEEVRLTYYQDGRLSSIVRAPAARFDTETRNLRMVGRTTMHSAVASTSFAADDVRWNAGSQRLQAQGNVIFDRGPSRLAAHTLEADRSLSRVRLDGAVVGRFLMPAGSLLRNLAPPVPARK